MYRKNEIGRLVFGKRIFGSLLFLLVGFIFLYGYFISTSIFTVIVREEVDRDIITISSTISELEAKYLSLKNEITLEYAYSHGFLDISSKSYTQRASSQGRGLTVNSQ